MRSSSEEACEEETNDGRSPDEKRSPSSPLPDCQICGSEAHGIHFGAVTCRACAAFFRRTIILNRQYRCRRARKTCIIVNAERLCRYCRFQKCLEAGMQADKVKQTYEKAREVRRKPSSKQEFPLYLEDRNGGCSNTVEERFVQSLLALRKPGANKPTEDTLLDVMPMISRVARLFENATPLAESEVSMLQCLTRSLSFLRRNQNPTPAIFHHMSNEMCREAWEQQLYSMPQWAMRMHQFSRLPEQDKFTIYQATWASFYRLERIHQTIEIYGPETIFGSSCEIPFTIMPEYSILLGKTTFDLSFITDYDSATIEGMFHPYIMRLYEEVAKPMANLMLTDTELAFLLGQLVWHLEGRKVTPETLLLSERIRCQMCNDLHDYYVNDRGMNNYASRLQRIMRILNDVEDILYERAKVLDLARLFDVFKITVSDTVLRSKTSR